ncbi:MAG: helicase-related protein [Actinomycetota bacterium]
MSKIVDNGENTLSAALSEILPHASAFDACVGYFNLRGWRQLRDAIGEMKEGDGSRPPVRLLVGMAVAPDHALRQALEGGYKPVDLQTAVARSQEAVLGFAQQLIWGIPTKVDEAGLRQLRKDLELGLLKVKFAAREQLHAKLYVAHLPAGPAGFRHGIVGSSNFTAAGLGKQGELSLEETDIQVTKELADWFDARWDDNFSIDVTYELIDVLEQSWIREDQPLPYHVYLRLAYELSRDAREGLTLDIPSEVKRVLLPHQISAVQVATKLLERKGIAVIGDVVGLGKTLTGTAIAATVGESVLVIAPKNLTQMWEEHLHRFHIPGKVVSLSMVRRELPELRRYKLVLVDESHNLRTRGRKAWDVIQAYIEENESKVVLLTATMFNARHKDIGGQLGLKLLPDEPLGVRPEKLIADIGPQELAKKTGGRLDSLAAFERSEYNEDWQRLLSEYLVRRTRKFLEQTYGEKDPKSGEVTLKFPNGQPFHFPKRSPEPLRYPGGANDPNDRLATDETFDAVANLSYARYQLGKYLDDNAAPRDKGEVELIEDLKTSVSAAAGFIRTTALKRLTSSAHAFVLTIKRMIARNYVLEFAIKNDLSIPLGNFSDVYFDLEAVDSDADEGDGQELLEEAASPAWGVRWKPKDWESYAEGAYRELVKRKPKGIRWARSTLFTADQLVEHVQGDSDTLQGLLDAYGIWDAKDDTKLHALGALIESLAPGEKILVFSEYKDTVDYLAAHLSKWTKREYLAASGGAGDPLRLARRFAPRANEHLGGLPEGETEVDVLLSTDVLSEGQNLQDAAIVVNWDLPWTTIKVIQRAGRVDRVGQVAETIRVLSFLPQDGIESVIRLFARLDDRLKAFQEILGGNEDFFRVTTNEDFIKGLFDGSAVLGENEGEVDASSYALGVWESADNVDRRMALDLQEGVYSTKTVPLDAAASVITYGRTDAGADLIVQSAADGVRFLTPMEALKLSESEVIEPPADALDDHLEHVARAAAAMNAQVEQNTVLLHHGLRKHLYDFLARQVDRIDLPEITRTRASQLIDAVTANPVRDSIKSELVGVLRSIRTLGDDGGQLERLLTLHDENALVDVRHLGAERVQVTTSMGFNPIALRAQGADTWRN